MPEPSADRLRQKIRVPYEALQANVARLQRVQQANDALRRMARFAVLTKRLEAQMSELGGYAGAGVGAGGDGETRGGANGAGDTQEDKERTIAKAALSIAELSTCCVFGVEAGGFDATQVPCLTDPPRRIRRGHMHSQMASRRYRQTLLVFRCVQSMQQPHISRSSLILERRSGRRWGPWSSRGLLPWCVPYMVLFQRVY